MHKNLRWLGLIFCSIAMVGCTVLQPLTASPATLRHELKEGDRVEITTSAGQQLRFTVQTVDDQGIHGGNQNIAFNDIQSVSRRQIAGGRTALLVLGIVAAGAAAAGGGGGGGGGSSY